uniref:TENA/THI-4 domain-containing protein (PqqC) n=1 Tax=uncultured marine thaumarchaeote KM3_88_C09 TaxID=1456333 RepID=A0A075HWM0_9ARCH|nr:TENA/THI-4 domain-containing protein (pqqC) [uncultured marine thaumarchaeote KM3_88_C09]
MNFLISEIDRIIEERSLLKHPFYQSWSDGKLTREALAGYSKEYYQLVKAVPIFMTQLIESAPQYMQNELDFNQQEEFSHINLWQKFAAELGISYEELNNYDGLYTTNHAISGMHCIMTSFSSGSAAMYALEKEIPKISQIKLEGLAEFYGLTNENVTRYFKEHMEADIRHTKSWRSIIEGLTGNDQEIISAVEGSVTCQNLLLDSCYEEYC